MSSLAVMSGLPLSSGSYPSRIIVRFIAAWWFSIPPISSSNLPLTVEEQSSTPHASFRLVVIQLDRSMLNGEIHVCYCSGGLASSCAYHTGTEDAGRWLGLNLATDFYTGKTGLSLGKRPGLSACLSQPRGCILAS